MSKILILKNDRVGDLANSLNGINSLLNENRDKQIEIILSDISKDLSFLFKIENVKITYLKYCLNAFDKVKLFLKIITANFEKISSEERAQSKNNILKSYELLLNNRYQVVVNEKTLKRVKNYFK